MKSGRNLLFADSIINLVLGALLLFFPAWLSNFLGIPSAASAFYPSILGAVLIGIGFALLLRKGNGLGLVGAVTINISGGVVLGLWLLFGNLELPLRGYLFLWGLVLVLVGISTFEFLAFQKHRKTR